LRHAEPARNGVVLIARIFGPRDPAQPEKLTQIIPDVCVQQWPVATAFRLAAKTAGIPEQSVGPLHVRPKRITNGFGLSFRRCGMQTAPIPCHAPNQKQLVTELAAFVSWEVPLPSQPLTTAVFHGKNAKRVGIDRQHRGLCGGFGAQDGDRRWRKKREWPRGAVHNHFNRCKARLNRRPPTTATTRGGWRLEVQSWRRSFRNPTVIRSLAGSHARSDWGLGDEGSWENGTRLRQVWTQASWVWAQCHQVETAKLVQRLLPRRGPLGSVLKLAKIGPQPGFARVA